MTNFYNKATFTHGNRDTILKLFSDALVKSSDDTRRRLLRLIPTQLMRRVLK